MSVEQIQALADGLATRLGRAVLVDDRDLRLVAASVDFGDADPARVWSLLHRRTRPEDVRHEEIARLPGPGYVPENPALELWQRLCVPIRCRGLLLGFVWITDRFGDLTEEQVADSARTAAEIGVVLHGRLLAGGRDRVRRHELAEQLLSQDAAIRSVARDEVVDRGLLDDDGQVAVLLIRHSSAADGLPHESPTAFLDDVERFFRDQSGVRTLTACWPRRATVIITGRASQHGEWLGRSVRALLGELSKAGSWRIGAGGPVQGLTELSVAKRQADIALSTVDDCGAACWAELSADALLAPVPAPGMGGCAVAGGSGKAADRSGGIYLAAHPGHISGLRGRCAAYRGRTARASHHLVPPAEPGRADLRAEPARRSRPAADAPDAAAAPHVRGTSTAEPYDRCRRTAAQSATACRMTRARPIGRLAVSPGARGNPWKDADDQHLRAHRPGRGRHRRRRGLLAGQARRWGRPGH